MPISSASVRPNSDVFHHGCLALAPPILSAHNLHDTQRPSPKPDLSESLCKIKGRLKHHIKVFRLRLYLCIVPPPFPPPIETIVVSEDVRMQ